MHILIIPSSRFTTQTEPHSAIFQWHQAKVLKENGNKVGVLSVGYITLRHFFKGYEYLKKENKQGVDILREYSSLFLPHRYIPFSLLKAMYIKKGLKYFEEYIEKHGKPDIIHAHNVFYGGFIAEAIKKKYGIEYIITEHNSAYDRGDVPLKYDSDVKSVLDNSKNLSAVSTNFAKNLQERYKVKFNVLPNLVDSLFFQNELPLSKSDTFTFLNIASIDSNKNQQLIIKAFTLKFKGSPCVLKIGGSGELKSELITLSKELGIESQVVFLGNLSQEEVRKEMKNADCFVLSSNYETFGVVLIEALACKTPVISTKCGGPQDIVHDKNGLLIDIDNKDEMAQAMEYMYENTETFDCDFIVQDVQERFGQERFIEQTIKLYNGENIYQNESEPLNLSQLENQKKLEEAKAKKQKEEQNSKIIKKEFNYNVFTLLTGTTIAQAIPILISPILTRVYTPEAFGVFAVFFGISVILGNMANTRYEQAIMIPKKDEDAINIFALGFIISLILSMVLLLGVILFSDVIVSFFGYKEMSVWLYFIPIAVFFIGLYNVLNYFNNRKKYYKDISKSLMIKAFVLSFVQVSVGIFKSGSIGLILGEVLSRVFANLKLLQNTLKNKKLIASISYLKMIAVAKRYKKFPLFNLPSTVANTTASYLPFILIPKIFGLTISGYFMLAQTLISLPSALIAKAFSQVLFQKMAENRVKKIENLPILKSTILKLTLIAIPIVIIIYAFSPMVFSFIFGQKWIVAGEIVQILSIAFFITFITSTVSIALLVYSELKALARWQFGYLFSSIVFFSFFLIFPIDFNAFLLYFVIHESILYLIYLYIIIRTVVNMDRKLKANR